MLRSQMSVDQANNFMEIVKRFNSKTVSAKFSLAGDFVYVNCVNPHSKFFPYCWMSVATFQEKPTGYADAILTPEAVQISCKDGRSYWRTLLPFTFWKVKSGEEKCLERDSDLFKDFATIHLNHYNWPVDHKDNHGIDVCPPVCAACFGDLPFGDAEVYDKVADLRYHARCEYAIKQLKGEEVENKVGTNNEPVDRSKRCMLSGNPETPDHMDLRPDGMQKDYVVLCPDERAKGFVRPVRRSYVHVGCRPTYATRDLTNEEKQRFVGCNYVKFEAYSESESPVTGRYWTAAQLSSGCGTKTTMGLALAETYARDPKFYGGTFCCGCGVHLPLEEFVWDGTNEQVGS